MEVLLQGSEQRSGQVELKLSHQPKVTTLKTDYTPEPTWLCCFDANESRENQVHLRTPGDVTPEAMRTDVIRSHSTLKLS